MKTTVKDASIYLQEGKLEVFTPQDYMDGIGHIDGDSVYTFGAVPYKFYNKPDDKKPTKVGIINVPSMVKFFPTYIDTNVLDTIWDGIYDDLTENNYTRMTFHAGARIMEQNVVKHINNTMAFLDLLVGRKLDTNIPYPMLSNIFVKNCVMNGFNLECPICVLDMMIYKVCRSKKDVSKPFAYVIGKDPKTSPIAYQFVNIRDICSADSVFAAVAFEDMNNMLDSSLNMTIKEQEQNVSPLEQIIKM